MHVLHADGRWYLGRLRAWQHYDGMWHAAVEYTVRSGVELHLNVSVVEVRQPGPGLEAVDGMRIPEEPEGAPGVPDGPEFLRRSRRIRAAKLPTHIGARS